MSTTETEERLTALEARIALLERLLEATPDLPEACRQHECDYYAHYLRLGPAELSHASYHEVEQQHSAVLEKIEAWYNQNQNTRKNPWENHAERLERRLRA